MITSDGLKERLDAHRQSTNPWAVIAELKLQLAAAQTENHRLITNRPHSTYADGQITVAGTVEVPPSAMDSRAEIVRFVDAARVANELEKLRAEYESAPNLRQAFALHYLDEVIVRLGLKETTK